MAARPPGEPDWRDLQYEPLAGRPSKVKLSHLGIPPLREITLTKWLDLLPDVLAARDLKRLRDAIIAAFRAGRPVIAALGGHVIKTGCAPYLIDLARRGVLTGVALNGSAAIHDIELAIAGHTSEDVGPRLNDGTFGFARETSLVFELACRIAAAKRCGLGAALAQVIEDHGGPGLEQSLLAATSRLGLRPTVHAAIGTDIVHMNPELDGASLGTATLDDFRHLASQVRYLAGGVWLNLGSAVVMPEIFLKAVAMSRNLGIDFEGLTTANLDFAQQYRGLHNVLKRPGGQGIALTGHHELMIPLLHAAIVGELEDRHHLPAPHWIAEGNRGRD